MPLFGNPVGNARRHHRAWFPFMGVGLVVAAALAPTIAAAQKPSVYYPVDRVVCDRKGRACYDPLGASVPLTRAHLGEDAAALLAKRIEKAGKHWNPNRFVLTNGVECFVEKKACYVAVGSEQIEPVTTKALFGGR